MRALPPLLAPLLLPLLLSGPPALAYDGVGGEHVYVFPAAAHADGDAPTVFSTSLSDLEARIARPDATGSIAIPGYNLSSTPANVSADWTLSLAVTVDVPVPGVAPEAHNLAYALSALSLTAPDDDVLVPARSKGVGQDDWRLCAIVFPGLNDTATHAGQGADDDCTGALSAQCREDLLSNVRRGHNSWGGQFCSDAGIPKSCPFSETVQPSTIQLQADQPSFPFYALGAAPAPAGNTTKALQAITNIWPVLVSWEHRKGGFRDGGDATTARSDLYCLRASNVSAESAVAKLGKQAASGGKSKGGEAGYAVPPRDDGVEEMLNLEDEGADESGAGRWASSGGVLAVAAMTMAMVVFA